MARACSNALELLVDTLKTTLKTIAKTNREVEQRMQSGHGPNDVKLGQPSKTLAASKAPLPKLSQLPWKWVLGER